MNMIFLRITNFENYQYITPIKLKIMILKPFLFMKHVNKKLKS